MKTDRLTKENCIALLSRCTLCPRECGANRAEGGLGWCGQSADLFLGRAALHFGEEPCICPDRGSGAVFFSGCNLKCVFCQNYSISTEHKGQSVTPKRLAEIFLELQDKGAANINLVTGSHYIPQIVLALQDAKAAGLSIPVVFNSSGYEKTESLRLLEGLVDIYLPDLKYVSSELSAQLSGAPDYFEKASLALQEMYRQTGEPVFDENGLMKKGMIVRHLCLPNQAKDTKKVLRYLYNTFHDSVYISILNQYTPMPQLADRTDAAWLCRKLTQEEYAKILAFAEAVGIENGFFQEENASGQCYIPDFSFEGL